MASQYKISYFPVKALAEPLRMMLSYGKLEFEDNRFEREDWPELKPKMPFEQVPVLEVNGKMAHQSLAIARYLAKQVNLVGSNDWENLEVDAIVDTLNGLRSKIALYSYEEDSKIKESCKEPLFKETIPFYLTRLDAIAKNNNGHLACDKLTWADFILAGWIDYLNYIFEGKLLDGYPNLQAVVDNVTAIEEVKAWIEKRPETDF